jgi:mono/diheme cytochrome c family protein
VTHILGDDRNHDARMRSPLATAVALHVAVALGVLGSAASLACEAGSRPSVDAGRDLYARSGCASCHGPRGEGDGPVGRTLGRAPRNLHDPATFTQGTDVDSIAATIATGVIGDIGGSRPAGQLGHHTQVMPRFDHLSDVERRSLALYVISLQGSTDPERNQP